MTAATFKTDRLILAPLQLSDSKFIQTLVNTSGWLRYIGDRNIKSENDAEAYIQRIIENPDAEYWVVYLKQTQTAIGILTFIKRDYLDFHDFGFAFLPDYAKKGYAYEASVALLKVLMVDRKKIQAITINDNQDSIKLLERLGFIPEGAIENQQNSLLVFGYSSF